MLLKSHVKAKSPQFYFKLSFPFQYGLKKKEEPTEEEIDPMSEGRVGRKKKTPAELAAEANKEDSDDDEFASKFSNLCCCLNFI